MLYLGIDQHPRQLAVSLHDQHGDVLLAWQAQPFESSRFSWSNSTGGDVSGTS